MLDRIVRARAPPWWPRDTGSHGGKTLTATDRRGFLGLAGAGAAALLAGTGPAAAAPRDPSPLAPRLADDPKLYFSEVTGTWPDLLWPPRGTTMGNDLFRSFDSPTLIHFQNRFWCVFRGYEDTLLRWTTYDGSSWTDPVLMPHHASQHAVGLAVVNNGEDLMCVHRGAWPNESLWFTRYSSVTKQWSLDVEHTQFKTTAKPALAVFRGIPRLVFRGAGDDQSLYYAAWNPRLGKWGQPVKFPQHLSDRGPSLVTDGQNHLMCVYRGGNGDRRLWYTYWDESTQTWAPDKYVHNAASADGAALCYNRHTGQVVAVYRGDDDSYETMHYTTMRLSTGEWSGNVVVIAGHVSAVNPAVAMSDSSQNLLCVYRGGTYL